MATKRIKKDRILIDLDELAFDGRPASAFIQNVKAVLADFEKPECYDAVCQVEFGGFKESDRIYIVTFRDETEKETEKRLVREKKRREQKRCYNDKLAKKQRERELAELARLQKKYSGVG